MVLYNLPTGDVVHRYKKSIVIPFEEKRTVLSTSPLNGGYQEELKAVFNQDCNPGAGIACKMKAATYEEHIAIMAREIGLNSEEVAGISTAANMENVAIHKQTYEELEVTAIVTGGIEVNGGRVGDPATWYEETGIEVKAKEGTINIILVFNTNLTKDALTRALVTCTEAKTAALQELLAPSRYSMGLATGSGTDGTILVCDATSDICLTNAGKHCKLGELIGKVVKAAVKEALYKQTKLGAKEQHNVIRRLDRFQITEDTLWEQYVAMTSENKEVLNSTRAWFEDRLFSFAKKDDMVVYASLYAHIVDQLQWGLLDIQETVRGARKIFAMILKKHSKETVCTVTDVDEAIQLLIEEMKETIVKSIVID